MAEKKLMQLTIPDYDRGWDDCLRVVFEILHSSKTKEEFKDKLAYFNVCTEEKITMNLVDSIKTRFLILQKIFSEGSIDFYKKNNKLPSPLFLAPIARKYSSTTSCSSKNR